MPRVNVTWPLTLRDQLTRAKTEQRTTRSDIIKRAIEKHWRSVKLTPSDIAELQDMSKSAPTSASVEDEHLEHIRKVIDRTRKATGETVPEYYVLIACVTAELEALGYNLAPPKDPTEEYVLRVKIPGKANKALFKYAAAEYLKDPRKGQPDVRKLLLKALYRGLREEFDIDVRT